MLDILRYYCFFFFGKKVRTACILFNSCLISKRKRYALLRKIGVSVNTQSTIIEPFYFEQGRIILIGSVFINANCVFLDAGEITI